jgi:hypothetical protein
MWSSTSDEGVPYLVTPEESIALFAFGIPPYCEQLLAQCQPLGSHPWTTTAILEGRSYLDAPFPDLVGCLLGFWPIQGRSKSSSIAISEFRQTDPTRHLQKTH